VRGFSSYNDIPSGNEKFHFPMKLQEFSSYLDKVRPIIESYPDKHSE
jgi:hypothetical protein